MKFETLATVAATTIPADPDEPPAVRVLLVEDHIFVREMMALLLEREAGRYRVVAEATTAAEAVTASRRCHPDLVVLDINLPGGVSGTEAMAALRRAHSPTRILICSGSCDENEIARALRTNPDGFVEKGARHEAFLAAAAAVTAGGRYLCPRSAQVYSEMANGQHGGVDAKTTPSTKLERCARPGGSPKALTTREQEVLALITTGHTSKEAAVALGVSVGTVVTHRANLMRKLKLHNAAALTRFAIAHGIILARGSFPVYRRII